MENNGEASGAGEVPSASQPSVSEPSASQPSGPGAPDDAAQAGELPRQVGHDHGEQRRAQPVPLWYLILVSLVLAVIGLSQVVPQELGWARTLMVYGAMFTLLGAIFALIGRRGVRSTGFRWRDNWRPCLALVVLMAALWAGGYGLTATTGHQGWLAGGVVLASICLGAGLGWIQRHDARRDRSGT